MKSIISRIVIVIFLLLSFTLFKYHHNNYSKVYSKKDIKETYVSVKVNDTVNQININDYLLGVVAGEMPASFEIEAIKAQVVASRTFVYSRLLSVDNTTNSQVYLDNEQIKVSWQEHYDEYYQKVKQAIKDTDGMVMKYQGNCISALFFSSSNGKTENVEDYFNGGPKDYLKSVDSPFDQQVDSKFIRTKHFTNNELKNKLNVDKISINNIDYKQSGRVNTINIGGKSFTGRQVRELLSLASSDFKIEKDNKGYLVTTKGSGHGVGMSQYGAQAMAQQGSSYQDILNHYYTNIEITKY